MATNYRKGKHSVTRLYVHLVFVAKYRRNVFTSESREILKQAMIGVGKKMDFEVVEFNGEADHVHVLVEYPPKLSISQIVNHLKGVSSRLYRKQFSSPHESHLWSPSYFAVSCGGAPIEKIKQYIQNQNNKKSPFRARLVSHFLGH
jgi:putative transposase